MVAYRVMIVEMFTRVQPDAVSTALQSIFGYLLDFLALCTQIQRHSLSQKLNGVLG